MCLGVCLRGNVFDLPGPLVGEFASPYHLHQLYKRNVTGKHSLGVLKLLKPDSSLLRVKI
jgi:hypothetical protein